MTKGNGEKGEPIPYLYFDPEEHMENRERLGSLKLLVRMSDDPSLKAELLRLEEKVRIGSELLKKLAHT